MSAAASARASVAIRVNGELIPADSAIPPDAVFPTYSITKTLTAICVLKSVQAGVFRLDDPIRKFVADVDLPDTITLTHLLQHTSGLRDYGPLREYHDAVRTHPMRPWTREQFLDSVIARGRLFAPGEGWSYSNVGYMLLVDALERTVNRPFAKIVERIITVPLGLTSTFTLHNVADMQRCVPGFGSQVTLDESVCDVRDVYHPGWCAPRLVASTTAETTRIFDALLSGELLEAPMLDRMFTLVPLPEDSGAPPSIGGGLGVYSDAASPYGRNYHHGGGGPGYSTSATIYPAMKRGRVAIALFFDSSEGPIAQEVENQWLEKIQGWR